MTTGSSDLVVTGTRDCVQARNVGRALAHAWGLAPSDQTRMARGAVAVATTAIRLWGKSKMTIRIVPGSRPEMEFTASPSLLSPLPGTLPGPVVSPGPDLAAAPEELVRILDEVQVRHVRNQHVMIIGKTRCLH